MSSTREVACSWSQLCGKPRLRLMRRRAQALPLPPPLLSTPLTPSHWGSLLPARQLRGYFALTHHPLSSPAPSASWWTQCRSTVSAPRNHGSSSTGGLLQMPLGKQDEVSLKAQAKAVDPHSSLMARRHWASSPAAQP